MENDTLYHHGTLGMKWGEHKARACSSGATKKVSTGKTISDAKSTSDAQKPKSVKEMSNEATKKVSTGKTISDAKSTSDAQKPTSVKEMSNEEIKAKIARIRLENDYKSLTPKDVNRGKNFVKTVGAKFMDKSADAVADLGVQAVKALGAKGMNKVMSKVTGSVGEYVFANNKKK